MTKEKLPDRIFELINVTKQLLIYSQKLKELHDKHLPAETIKSNQYKNSEIPNWLRLLHCTFYFDALLNLNTLLNPVQKNPNKKQQSIFELIELETNRTVKNKLLQSANDLREELKKQNLIELRHKLVGHKDIEKAGDTTIMYLNFIKGNILNCSICLLNDIESFIQNNYDITHGNLFASLYDKSFNKMLTLFENELNCSSKNL